MLKLQPPWKLGDMVSRAAGDLAEGLAALGATVRPAVELRGDPETLIYGLSSADDAAPGGIAFAVTRDYLDKAVRAGAAAVIIPPALAGGSPVPPVIVCPEPRLVFAVMLGFLGQTPPPSAGQPFFIDRDSCQIGPGAVIGQGAHIGRQVTIGRNTVIDPQVIIEDGVSIGADCRLHPRAVLRWGTKVGDRCQIHCGAVIGDDGFGYTQLPDPAAGRLIHYKNEHRGGVVIEDDVEIGAQTAIDRGLVSDTVIGRGTKIDNLVQIGHNCRIGRDCIIVSQTGIGGHTVVGDRVFLLGQAGLGPGVTIGHDAIVSAQSGLGSGSLPAGRQIWSGTPVRTNEETYKIMALSASQLPKVRRFFQALKKSTSFEELRAAFHGNADKQEKPPAGQ